MVPFACGSAQTPREGTRQRQEEQGGGEGRRGRGGAVGTRSKLGAQLVPWAEAAGSPSAEERARAATRRARARGKATAHIFPVHVPSAVDQPLELRGLTGICGIVHVGHI